MAATGFCGLGRVGLVRKGYENRKMDSRVLFGQFRIGAYSGFVCDVVNKGAIFGRKKRDRH